MNNTNLDCVDDENDFGVVVSSNLKPSKQCAIAASRANRMLGLIRRVFIFLVGKLSLTASQVSP